VGGVNCTPQAKSFIEALLTTDPAKRLGSGKGGGLEVRGDSWLSSIQFSKLEQRQMPAPFLPEPDLDDDHANQLTEDFIFFPEDHPAFIEFATEWVPTSITHQGQWWSDSMTEADLSNGAVSNPSSPDVPPARSEAPPPPSSDLNRFRRRRATPLPSRLGRRGGAWKASGTALAREARLRSRIWRRAAAGLAGLAASRREGGALTARARR